MIPLIIILCEQYYAYMQKNKKCVKVEHDQNTLRTIFYEDFVLRQPKFWSRWLTSSLSDAVQRWWGSEHLFIVPQQSLHWVQFLMFLKMISLPLSPSGLWNDCIQLSDQTVDCFCQNWLEIVILMLFFVSRTCKLPTMRPDIMSEVPRTSIHLQPSIHVIASA